MYTKLPIGTNQPGLIVILVDQSSSMSASFGVADTKMNFAALAVNRCVYEIITGSQSGTIIKNRCQIGLYGYNSEHGINLISGGWVSEFQNNQLGIKTVARKVSDGAGGLVDSPLEYPYWVEPVADGSTPMDAAFESAASLIEKSWLPSYPDSFPPIVINITDGAPDDPELARQAANRLTSLKSNDGNVILLNAHISNDNTNEIKLPSRLPSGADGYAQFIFDISSVLPPPLLAAAQNAGFSPQPGARGCVYNAGAETLTRLIVFGSTPMKEINP
jgi:hypothetical protein